MPAPVSSDSRGSRRGDAPPGHAGGVAPLPERDLEPLEDLEPFEIGLGFSRPASVRALAYAPARACARNRSLAFSRLEMRLQNTKRT